MLFGIKNYVSQKIDVLVTKPFTDKDFPKLTFFHC